MFQLDLARFHPIAANRHAGPLVVAEDLVRVDSAASACLAMGVLRKKARALYL